MTPSLQALQQKLRRLPGLGPRSAERLALHLLIDAPADAGELITLIQDATEHTQACEICGNISEQAQCSICENPERDPSVLCIVETIPDLWAIEKGQHFKGRYHVLGGRLSPINNVHPENLNFETLKARLADGTVQEIILALASDIESQATCHYIQNEIVASHPQTQITRIGFGLPTGSSIGYADPLTLQSALEGRRSL